MDEKIRVLIFDVEGEERDELVNMLDNVEYIIMGQETENYDEAEHQIEENDIDVVLLGASAEFDGYETAERLYEKFPDLAIIILEGEMHEESLHRAFFVGAKDVIYLPYKLENLVDSIYKAHQKVKNAAANVNPEKPRTHKKTSLGQIFTIFGAKGGIGRTFIAINTAITLKKVTGKRVALVDLDLDFGSVALTLNLEPNFTIVDVLDDIRNIDQDMIESYLLPHESGINVLASGVQPMSNEFVHAEDIEVILRTLQKDYDYVVVDMPARFDEKVNPAFLISDKIFVITTPEVSALRNTKMAMVTLEDFSIQKAKILLLLNKAEKKDIIRKKDVEATLNKEIYATFTNDIKNVLTSINFGIPVVSNKSARTLRSEFTKLVNNILASGRKSK